MSWVSADNREPVGRYEYAAKAGRILFGQVIVATYQRRGKGYAVAALNGEKIGTAESPAHAMLMAMRAMEAKNG